MKMFLALTGSTALGLVTLSAAASTPLSEPLTAHQEPRGIGNLVMPGDRIEIAYDTPGARSATGSLYVRNDLQRRFQRLPLRRVRGTGTGLVARVPGRLIRGRKLLYYAVVRDPKSGRSATLPAAGARAPRAAWILERPVAVTLGTHRFGRTRAPDAIVAHTGAAGLGWQTEGDRFGPQTFLVGRDRSIWLDDSLNNRLLVWQPGRPEAPVRSVPLPDRSADHDVALGPAGSVYVTGVVGRGLAARLVLYRLSATGKVIWQLKLAGDYAGAGNSDVLVVGANSALRTGPDGVLYCLAAAPSLPGGERAWMPVATPSGRPLSLAAQRRGTRWPDQPLAGGRRLIAEVFTAKVDAAPHEARFAIVDRRGRLVRSWRIVSRTAISFGYSTLEVVGGDPVVLLDVTAQSGGAFRWE